MWFIDSTGKLRRALVDTSGHIQVDILTSPAIVISGSVGVTNFPSDYADAAVAKLLGAGLPSALTSDKLKVRASEIETLLAGGLPAALDGVSLKVKEQSPLTAIQADIYRVLGSAISLTNYLPVGIAYPAGTLIDPRDASDRAARLLGIVYGDKGQLAQRATTKEALIDIIRVGGTAQTGRDITPDLKVLTDVEDTTAVELGVIPKAKGKTTIVRRISRDGAGTNTIYTVTNGKTFYLTAMWLSGKNNTDISSEVYIDDSVNLMLEVTIKGLGASGNNTLSPAVPMPFPAGTVFRLSCGLDNQRAVGGLMGWEE